MPRVELRSARKVTRARTLPHLFEPRVGADLNQLSKRLTTLTRDHAEGSTGRSGRMTPEQMRKPRGRSTYPARISFSLTNSI